LQEQQCKLRANSASQVKRMLARRSARGGEDLLVS
jgi:hypothetical protein